MPTRVELKALYEQGRGERNIDPLFVFSGWKVWAEERNSSSAWYFTFTSGFEDWGGRTDINFPRVFGVRASPRR
jgi:hypothetical protein